MRHLLYTCLSFTHASPAIQVKWFALSSRLCDWFCLFEVSSRILTCKFLSDKTALASRFRDWLMHLVKDFATISCSGLPLLRTARQGLLALLLGSIWCKRHVELCRLSTYEIGLGWLLWMGTLRHQTILSFFDGSSRRLFSRCCRNCDERRLLVVLIADELWSLLGMSLCTTVLLVWQSSCCLRANSWNFLIANRCSSRLREGVYSMISCCLIVVRLHFHGSDASCMWSSWRKNNVCLLPL